MTGSKKFVLGFFVGSILGATGALLFAPVKGTKLRRDLKRGSHKVGHRVSETAEAVRDRGKDLYEATGRTA
jgi:gas vesicle protein